MNYELFLIIYFINKFSDIFNKKLFYYFLYNNYIIYKLLNKLYLFHIINKVRLFIRLNIKVILIAYEEF